MLPLEKQTTQVVTKEKICTSCFVFGLEDVDKTKLMAAGGKGANLGELCKIEGVHVPEGICVSTEAFKRIVMEAPAANELLQQLSLLKVEDRDTISELSGKLRRVIEGVAIPQDIHEEISRHVAKLGEKNAYAVRSSATAEDLPQASFAGQHDTYLNIIGKQAILQHVSKCWASLFTDRAVTYRMQNGFAHNQVFLSVIVQRMVLPQASGILFTADPVTGNRKLLSINAGFGLGEALVSGLVSADCYKVRSAQIVDKMIAGKKLAMHALKEGGTATRQVEPEKQKSQTLTDIQIVELARIGRQVEAHFGCPLDIEWCLADDTFYVVQSRPITTLFPIPARPGNSIEPQTGDVENHVYVSVGHQQMMTDAIKPLGLSLWQLTALRPMFTAGARQFVDITQQLSSPASRQTIIDVLGKSEPLIKEALTTLVERGDFIKTLPDSTKQPGTNAGSKIVPPAGFDTQMEDDPAIVADLIKHNQTSVQDLKQHIQTKSGTDLFDFILEDIQQLKKILSDPKSTRVFMAAMNASSWVNEKMNEWLGEKNAADILSQSVPNNITSQMGLGLLDVADIIRPYPEVIDYLARVKEGNFMDGLGKFNGGKQAQAAINAYLDKYGMRCAGEIDITKERWGEKPTMLIPIILNNITNFEPGASNRRFNQGLQEALKKEQELLERLKQLPDGEQKCDETKRMISQIRNFIGYREYPKYGIVNRYFVYKQALLKEAAQLVQAGIIDEAEDVYYLAFQEFREVVRTNTLDYQIIHTRKNEYRLFEKLSPPRVITSDGEIIAGKYNRQNLPANALAGLPVCAGVVEGRARVVLRIEDADLQDGDILVTAFTDPGWTPLFVCIKGLVTEVGGLMTHGAVIAREYGLPAVVGIENATKLIRNGQLIRVHGTEGYVQML